MTSYNNCFWVIPLPICQSAICTGSWERGIKDCFKQIKGISPVALFIACCFKTASPGQCLLLGWYAFHPCTFYA